MLDPKFIRENAEMVKEALRKKQVKFDLEKFLRTDEHRREHLKTFESLKAEQKALSGKVRTAGKEEKKRLLSQLALLKKRIKERESEFQSLGKEWLELLYLVPNLPAPDVKEGVDESQNEIIRKVGAPTVFDLPPKDYMTLGIALNLIDTERTAKASGSRFSCLKNQAVLLEFALVRFAFDFLQRGGFTPLIPPALITHDSMQGMGYLERGADEIYKTSQDNLYLVGTSEQSVGPLYKDAVFEEKNLPLRYAAFSSCFRREAGSYGKDTKGIFRVHQFDKVEMFSFTAPKDSDREHEYLLSLEEQLVQALGLPYQVVKMCSGDLGDQAARKYDIECWFPSQGRYRETHSCSNCTDFQARRLNIRYRTKETNGKPHLLFVHTLNGTAFAIGRTLIAIFENYQQKDGTIKIPEALIPYCGFEIIK